jgi:hypothetical protein
MNLLFLNKRNDDLEGLVYLKLKGSCFDPFKIHRPNCYPIDRRPKIFKALMKNQDVIDIYFFLANKDLPCRT